MSVKDVIKNSFLQGIQSGELSIRTIILLLIVAGLLGVFIFFIYKVVTINSFYSKSFNISLVLMSVITASIIITIQNSVVVSLGMVGALSIVRFRTAVKDPMDLIFMFWSISVGIICGAALPGLAIALSIGCALLISLFYRLPENRKSLILVVNATNNECVKEVYDVLAQFDNKYHIKSRNLTEEGTDFVMEIRIKEYEELLQSLKDITGVTSVSIVSNQGESVY